nr:hypothetical protein GCM10025732_07180 [Glycomyces mayteni]
MLADEVGGGQLDRVVPVEAGHAEAGRGLLGGADEAVHGDVAEGVGADLGADAVDVERPGDELGAGGEVDAVEARPLHGGRGDADVDLDGAGLAEHPHERPLRVAADDRVVDDDEALALDLVDQGLSLRRMPSWRRDCEGWMNVRPTYWFLVKPWL